MPEAMAREAGPGAPSAARASRRLGGVFETPPQARRAGRPSGTPKPAGRFGAGARMVGAQAPQAHFSNGLTNGSAPNGAPSPTHCELRARLILLSGSKA